MRRADIIGYLGGDAELKVINGRNGNTSVLNFSVAANGSKKEEDAEWVRCAMFGKRAESIADYMKKGKQVFARGEWKLRRYEKDGETKTAFDLTVDELELVGVGKEKSDGSW